MGLPRSSEITAAAGRTARRFPLVLLAGVLSAVTAIPLTEQQDVAWLGRTLAAASLGIALLTAARLAGERIGPARGWLADAVGLAVLALVWWRWPLWSEEIRAFRYAQLSVMSHLAVAFVPFVAARLPNAFWQFNRMLFERILLAAIYTGTLFVGMSLAFGAVDVLLGVDLADTSYLRLWLVLVFVFNTWVFLGGVPQSPAGLESVSDYPRGLRVFAQYVLVPLLSVYYLIFALYVVRVLATWDWPSGWTGYLVSAMAAVGILALLLVAPVSERPELGWVRGFARWFWLAMLPAVAVLWVAIGQRVQQYGVTEPRYFLIVLSVWLAGVALFYGVTRSRDFRIIPLSLGVVAVVTMFGPWGAYRVSESSQIRRMTGLLAGAGRLVEGQLQAGAAMASTERDEVEAVVRYLVARHGTHGLASWLPDSLVSDPPADAATRRTFTGQVVAALGVPAVGADEAARERFRMREGLMDIAGWRTAVRLYRRRQTVGDLTIVTSMRSQQVRVLRNDAEVVRFDLADVVAATWAARAGAVPDTLSPIRVPGSGTSGRGVFIITAMSIADSGGALLLEDVDGYVLLN